MGFHKKATKNCRISRLQKIRQSYIPQFAVSNFKVNIFKIIDKHAPIKQKCLRAKKLHRKIMKRSPLVNNFLKI